MKNEPQIIIIKNLSADYVNLDTNEKIYNIEQISKILDIKKNTLSVYIQKLKKYDPCYQCYKHKDILYFTQKYIDSILSTIAEINMSQKLDPNKTTRIYFFSKRIKQLDIRKFKKLKYVNVHQDTLIICREDQVPYLHSRTRSLKYIVKPTE